MNKKMLIAAFPEVSDIGKRIAMALKIEFTEIETRDFPDGEYKIKFKKSPNNKIVVIINSITKDPDERIVETILAEGIARDYKAKKVILVATYLPYMRQDTHFVHYDSFSAKHILEVFAGFDRIIVIDPHLHRIKSMHSLSPKAESITVDGVIANYIKKNFRGNFEIIGPDSESEQWSAKIAQMLHKKVHILNKTRFGDNKIKQKNVSLNKSKNYIVIDDIISTGHTLIGALKMAKEQGAKKLVCIGIHGLLIGNANKMIKEYASLLTTNTIPGKYAKIDVSPAIVERLRKEL